MTNKELYEWIGICLALHDRPEIRPQIIGQVSSGCIPWEKFVSVCSRHLITPTVYLIFKQNDILPHITPDLTKYLAEVTELNHERNKKIIRQMAEITNTLRNYRIKPIFLKGSGNLIDHVYPDIAFRMLGDIDFLVREQDYMKTVQILSDDGYYSRHAIYGDPLTYKHYPRLWKEDRAADIEIHRIPVSEKYNQWFNYRVIEKEMHAPHGNPDCLVLSDNHKIILNFIHSQLGHAGKSLGILSYRDVFDLDLLQKRHAKPVTGIDSRHRGSFGAYVHMSKRLMQSNGEEDFPAAIQWNLFYLIHQLNLRSRAFFIAYHGIRRQAGRIKAYCKLAPRIITSPEIRKMVFDRLSHPPWYRKQLLWWASIFSPHPQTKE